jgi:predicted membrane protein
MSVLGILITFCLAFCAYFLPALVARARDHRNASAIVVLIWAYTNDKAPAMARPSMAPGG